jgi:N-dimethylarginine dimethylaminohydrolase
LGVEVIHVGLAHGTMHLMGSLRFADHDLAIAWNGRVPYAAVQALRDAGYRMVFVPDQDEALTGMALNFVTLGPRRVLMAAGNPVTQAFYEDLGISCTTVEMDELVKAAGSVGCLTGILAREQEA